MSKTERWAALLVAVVLLIVVGTVPANATYCNSYTNSALIYIDGSGYCAGTGGGCSACFTVAPRGPGSWNLCYYDWSTTDLTCHYYM
jgi:hypothetical protein